MRVAETREGSKCRKCGTTLKFIKGNNRCVFCRRKSRREWNSRRHGFKQSPAFAAFRLSVEYYENRVNFQEGKCYICSKIPNRKLYIDHCHKTNLFRGLLCNACNAGIGMLKDDTELLYKAIKYLDEFA